MRGISTDRYERGARSHSSWIAIALLTLALAGCATPLKRGEFAYEQVLPLASAAVTRPEEPVCDPLTPAIIGYDGVRT